MLPTPSLCPHPYKGKGPIKVCDTAPRTQSPAPATNLGVSIPVPPHVGHWLWPGLGGTCCSWHCPKPFREVYFYQGRSHSWNPPRVSPSPHATRGPGGETRVGQAHPDPQESFPEPSCPHGQQHQGACPLTNQVPLPPFLPPCPVPSPFSHMPFIREERVPAPGKVCPKGGTRRLSVPPSLPHRAWHQEGSPLVWGRNK